MAAGEGSNDTNISRHSRNLNAISYSDHRFLYQFKQMTNAGKAIERWFQLFHVWRESRHVLNLINRFLNAPTTAQLWSWLLLAVIITLWHIETTMKMRVERRQKARSSGIPSLKRYIPYHGWSFSTGHLHWYNTAKLSTGPKIRQLSNHKEDVHIWYLTQVGINDIDISGEHQSNIPSINLSINHVLLASQDIKSTFTLHPIFSPPYVLMISEMIWIKLMGKRERVFGSLSRLPKY